MTTLPPSTPAPAVARRRSPASGSCRARARSWSTAARSTSTSATPSNEADVRMPFRVTDTDGRFNAMIKVEGGGVTGQAGAIRHGIARALLELDRGDRAAAAPGRPPHPRPADEGAQEVRPEARPQGAAVHQALGATRRGRRHASCAYAGACIARQPRSQAPRSRARRRSSSRVCVPGGGLRRWPKRIPSRGFHGASTWSASSIALPLATRNPLARARGARSPTSILDAR